MTIGETVYEGRGVMTINRIIKGGDGIETPTIELTLKGCGKSKGIEVTEIWTFIAMVNDDESSIADGQGMIFTKNRQNREMVVATARGLGKASKDEEMNTSQFVIFYKAKNPRARGQLNFLDNITGMARITVNEETMEYKIDVREWKLVPRAI
jgi:hypothetical protein